MALEWTLAMKARDEEFRHLAIELGRSPSHDRLMAVLRDAILAAVGADALRDADPAGWARLDRLIEIPVRVAAASAVEALAIEASASLDQLEPEIRGRLAGLQ